MSVRIFEVTLPNATTQAMWLCPDCATKRQATKSIDGPRKFNGLCDDCAAAHQAAPGYVTPTVDFAKTPDTAFHPVAPKRPKAMGEQNRLSPVLTEEDAA